MYAIQKLTDLATQIPFRLAVPVLKGTAVEEIHQHFRYPIEHTDYGIGLQSQVVPVEQCLGRESHHLAVFLYHRNQANLLDFGNLAFFQVEGNPVHLAHGTILLTCGNLCHYRLVHTAGQCRRRRNQQVFGFAQFCIASPSYQIVAGHTYVGLVHIASRKIGIKEHFNDIIRFFQISEIRVNHHLVVMRNLCPFFNNLVRTQISRDNQQGIVGTQVQTVIIRTKLVCNGIDKEGVVQIGKLAHRSVHNGDILDLVGIRILVEEHDRAVGLLQLPDLFHRFQLVLG